MKDVKRVFIEFELPVELPIEEIRQAIEDQLIMVVKETESFEGPVWHVAYID